MQTQISLKFATELEKARTDMLARGGAAEVGETIRLIELTAMFRIYLPEATDAERTVVGELQKDLRMQHRRLSKLATGSVIDDAEFSEASRREAEWCFRQCAQVLGRARFERLFGLPPEHAAKPHDEPIAMALASRYRSSDPERRQVIAAWKEVDPQSIESIVHLPWVRTAKIGKAVRAIAEAERSYQMGAVEESISRAQSVVCFALEQSRVGDIWVYLTSWALHIEGRAYESLMHLESAASQYEASLALKMQLKEWLPSTAHVATELKLGSIEVEQSPVQAITRLSRVHEALETNRKQFADNRRVYENLLEDSELKLAEAFIIIGRWQDAASHARSALKRARALQDAPGEIQVLFALHHADALDFETLKRKLAAVLKRDPRWAQHPKVARLLEDLG